MEKVIISAWKTFYRTVDSTPMRCYELSFNSNNSHTQKQPLHCCHTEHCRTHPDQNIYSGASRNISMKNDRLERADEG